MDMPFRDAHPWQETLMAEFYPGIGLRFKQGTGS
jgi:hypothetical protein